eukprot:14815932-Alexandrium_andersonii.AAC.1
MSARSETAARSTRPTCTTEGIPVPRATLGARRLRVLPRLDSYGACGSAARARLKESRQTLAAARRLRAAL